MRTEISKTGRRRLAALGGVKLTLTQQPGMGIGWCQICISAESDIGNQDWGAQWIEARNALPEVSGMNPKKKRFPLAE
jgi:hypothetical protein